MASFPYPEVAAENAAEKAARIAAWEAERIAKAQAQCLVGSSSTAAVEAEEEAVFYTPVMRAARLAEAARESLADCQKLTRLPGWQGEAWISHVATWREKVLFYEEQERLAREEEQRNSLISSIRLSQDPKRLAGYKRKTSKKYRKHRSLCKKHRSSRKKHHSSRKKHRKHRTRR
jgi:hypothetical protein